MSPLAKIGIGLAAVVLLGVLLQACLLGGGDSNSIGSIGRLGSVATATPPATLPTPLLLGQSQAGTNTTAGTADAGGSTYTVKSGDTLGAIAASLGIAPEGQAAWIADVLRLNGISDPRSIAVGQVLNLPRVAPVTTTPTARPTGTAQATGTAASGSTATRTPTPQATTTTTAKPTATTAPSGGGGTYTVVSGDYPLLIAQKLGVPQAQQTAWVAELTALNPGMNPNNLNIGQVLNLPASTPPR